MCVCVQAARMLSRIAAILTPAEMAAVRSQLPRAVGAHVVLGMSGGVDSSVAALLLKAHGLRVTGVWMTNWNADGPSCEQDFDDASKVAAQLGMECRRVDLAKEYWLRVWEPCLEDYARGCTPNPDVLCNREIKFGAFAKLAVESLGADVVATGHYARVDAHGTLLRSADAWKDQSYFLCMVNSFARACFPVGGLTKPRVRALAKALGLDLSVYTKPESTGVCFVGKQRKTFGAFLSDFIDDRAGRFVDADSGVDLGPAPSVLALTVGQRARLGGLRQPLFVVSRDVASGVVRLAKEGHPLLYTDRLRVHNVALRASAVGGRMVAQTGSRNIKGAACTVSVLEGGRAADVKFDAQVRRVGDAQVLGLYASDNVACWGGGLVVGG